MFNSQQSMHLDLKAANEFEVEDEELAQVFDERGIPSNVTGPLFEGQFRPYVPSENIVGKFYQIDAKNNTQSMEQALPVITEMIEAFQNAPLDKQFKFKLQDFGIDMPDNNIEISPNSFDPFSQSNLTTPPVNPEVVQTNQLASVSQTGLTPSEQALLSPEEQAIRLRQRGMA